MGADPEKKALAAVGSGAFVDTTGGAMVADHPARFHLPILVPAQPTGEEAKRATMKPPVTAIGCWRIPGNFFNFDSSFVRSDAQPAFKQFAEFHAALEKAYSGRPPVTLFGHADPTGPDPYNSYLSQRRAMAVYAVMTRDVTLFEEAFNAHGQGIGKAWGTRDTQQMLASVKNGDGNPYYDGPIDGKPAPLNKSIAAFQKDNKLPQSMALDQATRKKLFPLYMDFLLGDFKLGKEDFLGKGKGKGSTGDFQGCGDFNPVMLFSKDEEKRFQKPQFADERNKKNRRNRRVVAYLFLPGSEIDVDKWPCPSRNEGPAAVVNKCKARFWSDGDKKDARRNAQLPDRRHWFEMHESTFSCRFYQGFAARSPCEEYAEKLWKLALTVREADGKLRPLRNRRCVVVAGERDDSPVMRMRTDGSGVLRIPLLDEKVKMTVKVEAFGPDPVPGSFPAPKTQGDPDPDPDEDTFFAFKLEAGALAKLPMPGQAGDDEAVRQRLHNLGFGPSDAGKWTDADFKLAVRQFRKLHGLPQGDGVDDDLRHELRDEYGDDTADPHAHEEDDLDVEDKE